MKELNITLRDKEKNTDTIRAEGMVPGVFYGPKEDNTPVAFNAGEFVRIWDEVGGSAIVSLKGVGEEKEVLIHDVTWHPVKGTPQHVDFYCIERGKKLTVSVPLVFINEAPAEKLGGIVVKVMHELEIEVRPKDIPHDITVDLSTLVDLESAITVADLNLPAEIEPTDEPTETVVSITQAKDEPEEERTIDDIEIEGKGKEDEEDGDADSKE